MSGVAMVVVAAVGLVAAFFIDKQQLELNRKRTEKAREARHNPDKTDEVDQETIELLNATSDEQKNN